MIASVTSVGTTPMENPVLRPSARTAAGNRAGANLRPLVRSSTRLHAGGGFHSVKPSSGSTWTMLIRSQPTYRTVYRHTVISGSDTLWRGLGIVFQHPASDMYHSTITPIGSSGRK